MNISFIITTYNIAPYILQCLESLKPCLKPGDQVILVDDGSTDTTEAVIREFIAREGFSPEVMWTPIWLGTNTIGGVGIPGNIGLNHAECGTVFFVDGDDYMIPSEFLRARAEYEAEPKDIHFTDYLEFDEQSQETKLPADHQKWARVASARNAEEIRLAAINLIAVPWRKFYRTSFLMQKKIRFPEGAFFFEDNPFHWQVCMAAESIGFSRRIVCHHRINRPGQTMASTGNELSAFFTHFRTILSMLPAGSTALRVQASQWLLGNMSWHIGRLQPAAFTSYAHQARTALGLIPDPDWDGPIASTMAETMIWHYADRLRKGHIWDVIEAWRHNANQQATQSAIRAISGKLQQLETDIKKIRSTTAAQAAIQEFDALLRITGSKA